VRRAAVTLAVLAAAVAAAPRTSPPAAAAKPCTLFPKTFSTNRPVTAAPVAPDSDAIVSSIGRERGLHPDFGSGTYEGFPIGIPYDLVSRRTPRSAVRFEYADESDPVRYPIPKGVHIEGDPAGDGDRHALLYDRGRCRLFELYALHRSGAGWEAGSGATWNLRSNRLRPAGWTSADAAGLPILPLLARYEEVRRGRIDHALRMTVRRTRRAYVHPARHFASNADDPSLPRMGERLRLKASVRAEDFPPQARVIVRAMQRYGLIVADNGSDWYVSGAPHRGWDNDQLRTLGRITGSDFEVVRAQ
jgi:hypothetical protein